MLCLNQYMQRTFNPFHGAECKSTIATITPADVKRVANTYFTDKNLTIARYFPASHTTNTNIIPDNTKVGDVFKETNKYASSPKLLDIKHSHVAASLNYSNDSYKRTIIQHSYNNKTFKTQFSEQPNDIYTRAIVSCLGSGIDCMKSDSNIVRLTGALMMNGIRHGTKQIAEQEFQRLLEDNRIEISFSAKHASFDVHLKCPSEKTKMAFGIVSKLLESPIMPSVRFKIAQQKVLGQLESQKMSVDAMADNLLYNCMYPVTHPNHSKLITEQELQVMQISYKDILDFHTHLKSSPRVMTLLAASSVDYNLVPLIAPLNTQNTMTFPATEMPSDMPMSKDLQYEIEDKTSVAFRMGLPIDIHVTHSDFLPLQLGIRALAGGFGTRLMDEIRDKRGLTYGIGGGLISGSKYIDHSTTFMIKSSCNPKLLADLKSTTISMIAEFAEHGITQKEFENQQLYAIGSRIVNNDTPNNELDMLHSNILIGQSSNYLDSFADRVNRVTLSEVNALIKKHIVPSNFHIVCVGTFEK
jgi:zinc protease